MKDYKGNEDLKDTPSNGGSWVDENEQGCEAKNFCVENMKFEYGSLPNGEYCLGFVETKFHGGYNDGDNNGRNKMCIENIIGCEGMKNEFKVQDVLVIYCAKNPNVSATCIVGWYNHADVYRTCKERPRDYFVIAKKDNCVLLPPKERNKKKWLVPRKGHSDSSFGFGQSNVWYANERDNEELQAFLEETVSKIKEYYGPNWRDEYSKGRK